MPHPLPGSSSIDHRRFVQVCFDFGHCGKKNDGPPPDVLPDVLEHHHGFECCGIPHQVQRRQARAAQHMVHESVTAEDRCPYTHQHHPTDEVRQVDDGLNRALECH